MVAQPPTAAPKRDEGERLELTQGTAEMAFLRLGLRDAGGIWACKSADELLTWLKEEYHNEKEIEAFRAKGDVNFKNYLNDRDEKVRCLHERLLDGASDFTAARLLVYDFAAFLRDRSKALPVVKRKNFVKKLRHKEGVLFYQFAARAALREPKHLLATSRFERELGRGQFGLTYKVHDKIEEQLYCIKALALGEMGRKELEVKNVTKPEDARAEFETMSFITHDSLVNVFCFGEEADIFWAQLECCEGGDLQQRLGPLAIGERGAIEESVLFRWMHECIAGLEAIHKANVMHRDIKPENILLTWYDDKKAQCKLADMGLACDVAATNAFDHRGFVGTEIYMAPEVLKGKQYSAHADIFSLGMVLFELTCCGACKFDNKASAEECEELFAKLPKGRGEALTVKALQHNKDVRCSSHELLEIAQSFQSKPGTSFVRGDYFAYIAIASPPFMLANGLAFAEQVKAIETRLRGDQDTWRISGRCPICLSDADSTVAGADLQACRTRVFVWCATGHGWESSAGHKALTLYDLVGKLKNVELLIVCQKYGAKRAAELAIRNDLVKTVVWFSADIHGNDGTDIFFLIIAPLLDIAKSRIPTTEELRKIVSDSGIKENDRFGVLGNESASYDEWLAGMASPSGWLHVKVQDKLLGLWTRELDSSLRSLKMFSCDISHAARLKLKLSTDAKTAGDDHLECVWIKSSSEKETQESRCRAVALDICETFTFSGQHSGPFQLVRRISSQQDIDAAEAMLPDMLHPRRVLLWVDLLCSGGLLPSDEEYAHSSLVTTLEGVAACSSSTFVLFTSDKGSENDLQAVVGEMGSVDDAEFDIGEEEGAQGVEAANKHADAITLSADDPSALENFDLLRGALEKCLTSVPIAALYLNDGGGIVVRFCISDVALLHRLAGLVLTGSCNGPLWISRSTLQPQPHPPFRLSRDAPFESPCFPLLMAPT